MEALTEEEIFLQTKILVLEQVKTEMHMCLPTMYKEVRGVLGEDGHPRGQRRGGRQMGKRSEAGDGRRKCRAVVCGNQIQEEVELGRARVRRGGDSPGAASEGCGQEVGGW